MKPITSIAAMTLDQLLAEDETVNVCKKQLDAEWNLICAKRARLATFIDGWFDRSRGITKRLKEINDSRYEFLNEVTELIKSRWKILDRLEKRMEERRSLDRLLGDNVDLEVAVKRDREIAKRFHQLQGEGA